MSLLFGFARISYIRPIPSIPPDSTPLDSVCSCRTPQWHSSCAAISWWTARTSFHSSGANPTFHALQRDCSRPDSGPGQEIRPHSWPQRRAQRGGGHRRWRQDLHIWVVPPRRAWSRLGYRHALCRPAHVALMSPDAFRLTPRSRLRTSGPPLMALLRCRSTLT